MFYLRFLHLHQKLQFLFHQDFHPQMIAPNNTFHQHLDKNQRQYINLNFSIMQLCGLNFSSMLAQQLPGFFVLLQYSHHYYNIFMGNPLTSSKDLSISLLKLLECRMQWYIDFITWTSRPYFRLITGSSFTVFVLCRLNHIRCIRVTHSSLNR